MVQILTLRQHFIVTDSLKLLRGADNYALLNKSGCVSVDTRDDVADFIAVKTGMEIIGFQQEEISGIFQLLAAILKLGNVDFTERPNPDGTDGCDVVNIDGKFRK